MTDVSLRHGMTRRQCLIGTHQLHQKLLGEVRTHLLMGDQHHVIGLGVPGLSEMVRRPLIDEGGVAASMPAVLQKTLRMGRRRRLKRTQAVARPYGLKAIAQHLNGLIQALGTLQQASAVVHRLHGGLDRVSHRLKTCLIGSIKRLPITSVQHLQGTHHPARLGDNRHRDRRRHWIREGRGRLLMGTDLLLQS